MVHKSAKRDRRKDERGQSLVETALVVPFLLLLIVLVVDASRAFDAFIVLTNAAREGARYAAIEPEPTVDMIEDFIVEDVLGSGTNITHMELFATDNVELEKGGQVVTVTLSYDFPLWFGGLVGLDNLPLRRTATMPTAELDVDD
jgi:Flp pilus assembly protein TadG